LGKEFTSRYIAAIRVKINIEITGGSGVPTHSYDFYIKKNGNWTLIAENLTGSRDFTFPVADYIEGFKISATTSSPGASVNVGVCSMDFYTSHTASVVQTNSKTFDSNVKSIFVTANKVLNGDSTITVDVSSDGGSTWDATNQNLDEWIQLDGDGSDIVVKFNLNVDGSGNSPELYGYSYMVRV